MTLNRDILRILLALIASITLIACAIALTTPSFSQVPDENYERIYLAPGSIYSRGVDFAKTYNIVTGVQHVSSEEYENLIFFDTPEEAEALGYKPSETFDRDYACWKEGKSRDECWLTAWQ